MVFWIVWFIMGVAAILLFTALVIPRVMLKVRAATLPLRDKAVGRLTDAQGDVLCYAPADSVRPYISRYFIARDGEGMYFRGEWARLSAYAAYELTVFNAAGKILDIYRVTEKFNSGRETHITRLPEGTDYVALRLLCVDDTPIPAEPQPLRRSYAVWLAVLCLCLSVAADLLLWFSLTFAFNCLDNFTMTYHLPVATWAVMLVSAALAVTAVTCAFSLGGFFLRRRGYLHEP